MSAPASTGLLARLERWGKALIVPMGEVYPVDFEITPAIGTSSLGSCSVAAVVSAYDAILAHIPPMPTPLPHVADPFAGDNNVRGMMRRVTELYYEHENYFPSTSTYVICAVYEGEVALPDQMGIIQEVFRDMGLESVTHTYDVPGDRTLPGQGTVTVVSSYLENETAGVYVEDKLVTTWVVPLAMSGEEETSTMDQGEASATRDYEPGPSVQDYGLAADMQMPHDEDVEDVEDIAPGETSYREVEAPASKQPRRVWVEVHFTVISHMTRRDEYVYKDAKNRRVSTDRSDWKKGTHDGKSVWVHKGSKTFYYTHQKIKQ